MKHSGTESATLGRRLSRTILIGVTAAVPALAVVVALLGDHLRREVRAQILSRDVELLESVVALEYERLELEFDDLPVDYRQLAVSASALRGVLAMAIYDTEGWPQEFMPDTAFAPGLSADLVEKLRLGLSHARFDPSHPLFDIFIDAGTEDGSSRSPIVDLIVPVTRPGSTSPAAYARFWIDGSAMAAEFTALDRRLWAQGVAAWLVGSGLTFLIGYVAARRLRRVGDELEVRNRSLERANAELDLAARSSAVGAISAHLIHGLRNPLAGIGAYLRAHGNDDAREAARRMETLVRDTLAVLRAESAPRTHGNLSLGELAEVLRNRLQARAELASVPLEFHIPDCDAPCLPYREFNLILLILENLLANAIEAAPARNPVVMRADDRNGTLRLCVQDGGPGIPDALGDRLFQPGATSKPHGAGLGLAISRHLARALGGDLILESTGSGGSCFALETPLHVPDLQTPREAS